MLTFDPKRPLSSRKSAHFCINMFLQSFALVVKWFCSRKLDISKSAFLQNCDETLNYVKFKSGHFVCIVVLRPR